MNNNILLKLLIIVSRNASLQLIIDQGYTYSQISILINELIEIGYVNYNNDVLTISEEGNRKLLELYSDMKIHNSQQWILPQEKYIKEKLSKYDIIFPKEI